MKLRKYKLIRLVAACMMFALALGPLTANAEIVMQCPHTPGSSPVMCPDMHMAMAPQPKASVRPNVPPCCRDHAVQALDGRAVPFAQSIRSSCILTGSSAGDAIVQSVVPVRTEAVASSSTTALLPPAARSILSTDRIANHCTIDDAVALAPSHTARIHGMRAPPSLNFFMAGH